MPTTNSKKERRKKIIVALQDTKLRASTYVDSDQHRLKVKENAIADALIELLRED